MPEPSSVVVGFDGSAQGRDAIALGRTLADLLDLRLVVAGVVAYVPQAPVTAAIGSLEQAAVHEFGELRNAARDALAGTEAEIVGLESTSPVHALETLAAQRSAELIVVGSTHRGRGGRIAIGGMAERLLSAGPRAVAIAPRGYASGEGDGIASVGVGHDGSAEAEVALEMAARICRASGAELFAYRAIEAVIVGAPLVPAVSPRAYVEPPDSVKARWERAEADLSEALARVDVPAGKRETIEAGDPATVLHGAAEHLDLLVLGSRAYGPVRRVLLGSVSARVVPDAACPVIVVPRGEDDAKARRHRVVRSGEEAAAGLIPLT